MTSFEYSYVIFWCILIDFFLYRGISKIVFSINDLSSNYDRKKLNGTVKANKNQLIDLPCLLFHFL